MLIKRFLTLLILFSITGHANSCFKGEDGGYERSCGVYVIESKDKTWEIHLDDEEGYFTGYGIKGSNIRKFIKPGIFCIYKNSTVLDNSIKLFARCPYLKEPGDYSIEIFNDGSNILKLIKSEMPFESK
jgi:hypothetical protein